MLHSLRTVKAQLTLGFGLLAAMLVIVSALAAWELGSTNSRFVDYVSGVAARSAQVAELRAAVDERAIAARNLVILTDEAELKVEKAKVLEAHRRAQDRLAALKRAVAQPGVPDKARELVADIDRVEQAYAPVALAVVALATTGQHDDAVARMNKDCRPLLGRMAQVTDAYAVFTKEQAAQHVAEAGSSYARQLGLMIVCCVVALAAATVVGLTLIRKLMRQLGAEPDVLHRVAHRVAEGDLRELPELVRAPAGSVLASLGNMRSSLSGIVGQVREASGSIATGSSQIASGNTDLSHRTEEQASNLQQTAAAMEQFSSTVKSNADTARLASEMAQSASGVASKGGEVVSNVVSTMQTIATSSKKIADITGVIDGIAFQTNILALNAAVEAARAGEQGRGFAVVATEVRNLAQRSATAAKEIKTLIGDSVEKVNSGTRLVGEAGDTMHDIVAQVQRVSELIGQISTATAEQTSGIVLVGDAVSQLDQTTQQNAALVEESAAAAESLKVQANRMADMVRVFKLGEAAPA